MLVVFVARWRAPHLVDDPFEVGPQVPRRNVSRRDCLVGVRPKLDGLHHWWRPPELLHDPVKARTESRFRDGSGHGTHRLLGIARHVRAEWWTRDPTVMRVDLMASTRSADRAGESNSPSHVAVELYASVK